MGHTVQQQYQTACKVLEMPCWLFVGMLMQRMGLLLHDTDRVKTAELTKTCGEHAWAEQLVLPQRELFERRLGETLTSHCRKAAEKAFSVWFSFTRTRLGSG